MAEQLSPRQAKSLQTRERLLGAAVAEFKRAGMADADVAAIVGAAGVAHGTFFFHFPTKEHVLLELERREEERIATALRRFLRREHDLADALGEAIRLTVGLERRFGPLLFQDFLALHFSQTRPPKESEQDHPLIILVAEEIERAQQAGTVAADVNPLNSAVFFLLGLYALLITTSTWPAQEDMVADYLTRNLQSMRA